MMDGKAFGDMLMGAFLMAIFIAALMGFLLCWGVPKLWEVFRPWLHAITA